MGNMFKLNIKDTRTTSVTSFWCLYYWLWIYCTLFFSVSTVDFEQVNICIKLRNISKIKPGEILGTVLTPSILVTLRLGTHTINIYLLKVNTKKKTEQSQSRRSVVFIVNFKHISHLFSVFLVLTWAFICLTGIWGQYSNQLIVTF